MKKELAKHNWTLEFESKTAEEMWRAFSSELAGLVRENVPVRAVRSRKKPTWMTKEILQAIKRKRRLWKEAKKGKQKEQYEEAEKTVKRLIRNAERNYEKKLSHGNGGNSMHFSSYIKRKTKSRPSIGPLKNSKKQGFGSGSALI